jgi:single-strand DNA-binding protein
MVVLVGRLGQDPELKQTPGGASVCNFSIATTEKWTDKSGERHERTEWHRIVAWGRTADNVAQFLRKGSQVYVEGSLHNREYEDKDGIKRQVAEIKAREIRFLDSRERAAS